MVLRVILEQSLNELELLSKINTTPEQSISGFTVTYIGVLRACTWRGRENIKSL